MFYNNNNNIKIFKISSIARLKLFIFKYFFQKIYIIKQ